MTLSKVIQTVCTLAVVTCCATAALGQTTWYLDDNVPNDPGPGDPTVSDPLEDGSADHPFDAIQEGIDVTSNDDEVLVSLGTYNEAIDFNGRAIILRSTDPADWVVVAATIIDGTGLSDSVVKCDNSTDRYGGQFPTLTGFTITGGTGDTNTLFTPGNAQGGGMLNINSNPTVTRCVFRHNHVSSGGADGGGMMIYESSPTVSGCVFLENTARGIVG